MHRASIGRFVSFSCRVAILLAVLVAPATTFAQSETRERQAAAEAYDQGTASYLSGDYSKAAEWFETANRLSPAAPALIQAARAHQQAGHLTRAATLALRLTTEYASEPSALQFGSSVVEQLAPRFVRIEVRCSGCTLDVDGTLQESQVFFVEPGVPHNVTASFETGERKQDVEGEAGSTQRLAFEAPPPPIVSESTGKAGGHAPSPEPEHKPFSPTVTLIAGGATALLLAGSIISGIDTKAGVKSYEAAAAAHSDCLRNMEAASPSGGQASDCSGLFSIAKTKLDRGQSKERRTTALWIATGVGAAATAVIGLLLTDWSASGDEKSVGSGPMLIVGATANGANLQMKGTF